MDDDSHCSERSFGFVPYCYEVTFRPAPRLRSGPSIPTPHMNRILPFEGARGLLALWVVVYHVFTITSAHLPPLLSGYHAVVVFFALSGFVIALLLDRRREPYGRFLMRRFFRLYPAFATCVALALALALVGVMPLRVAPDGLGVHLALKALLLHGALPGTVEGASGSILNPAWSISTEWQFYLVVPAFFWLVRRNTVAGWTALLLAAAFSTRVMAPLGFGGASVLTNAFVFALGIGSYAAYAWVREHGGTLRSASPILPIALPILPLALIPIATNIGVLVWLALFGVVLSVEIGGALRPVQWAASALSSPPAVWLGMVSYSLYLGHEPLVWTALRAGESLGLVGYRLTAFVGLLSIPLSLALAAALYRYVEVPGIALGKRLTKRPVVAVPEVAAQASP